MIGIGPFVPASGTPFENEASGSAELTVFILAILRVMFPHANLPATTSLATLSKTAREQSDRGCSKTCICQTYTDI